MWFSAASISDCQVLVDPGITNPNVNDHSKVSKFSDQWINYFEVQKRFQLKQNQLWFEYQSAMHISVMFCMCANHYDDWIEWTFVLPSSNAKVYY